MLFFSSDRLVSYGRWCQCYSSRIEVILGQAVAPTAASPNHVVGQATDPCVPNPTWHALNCGPAARNTATTIFDTAFLG
jgi:hypothetical protein